MAAGYRKTSKRRRIRKQLRDQQYGKGARVGLHVDGIAFMPAILDAIANASEQVLVETYMISSDDTGKCLINALCAKASEGVAVWVVFDAVGSIGLTRVDRNQLRDAGVRLRMFNRLRIMSPLRSLFRTHRRIVVVDGEVGFVGGFGFTDQWMDVDAPWCELVWQVHGEPLRHMAEAFRRSWRRHHEKPQVIDFAPVKDGYRYNVLNKSRWGSPHLRRLMQRRIRKAKQRIWITTGYFVPPLYMVAALRRAAKRGVDVRLMLTGEKTDYRSVYYAGRSFYRLLLTSGVTIYETTDRMMHAKAYIIDEREACVGSSNLDNWSLRYNREFNITVHDHAATQQLEEAMAVIQRDSGCITLENWDRRSFVTRVFEVLFRMFERIL